MPITASRGRIVRAAPTLARKPAFWREVSAELLNILLMDEPLTTHALAGQPSFTEVATDLFGRTLEHIRLLVPPLEEVDQRPQHSTP